MGYIIWIVIGAVIVIMAIIGYVAEHSGSKEKVKKGEDNTSEANVAKIEAAEGSATWSKDAKPKDEKQEIMHEIPSIDDWTKIPDTEDNLPEANLDNSNEEVSSEPESENQPMFADVDTNKSDISEPTTEVLSAPESVAVPTEVPTPTPLPTPEPVEPVVLPATNNDINPTLTSPEVAAVPAVESTSVLESQNNEIAPEASLDSSQVLVNSSKPVDGATSQSSEPATIPVSEQITEPVNVENIWN